VREQLTAVGEVDADPVLGEAATEVGAGELKFGSVEYSQVNV
jgi:hypothetical protein